MKLDGCAKGLGALPPGYNKLCVCWMVMQLMFVFLIVAILSALIDFYRRESMCSF